MRKKILVTGGCSFSVAQGTWAEFAGREFSGYYSTALSSLGNDVIARRVLWQVTELLSAGRDARDLAVIVQWSSPDRSSLYRPEEDLRGLAPIYQRVDNQTINPLRWPPEDREGAWVIQNPNWQQPLSRDWYQRFWNPVEQRVKTAELWIMLSGWLASRGVDYLYSSYTREVYDPALRHHPQLEYLYDQVPFDRWVWPPDQGGELEWLRGQGKMPQTADLGSHPTRDQHEQWYQEVIRPRMVQAGWLG